MSTTTTTHAPGTSRSVGRVPYLPGLDGMRALAVVAVMVYHANSSWLPGGFLGVEVFFVISGYLITLLLIGEHERTGGVALGQFWVRRARRLLPALFTLLIGVTIYTALFRRDALGQLRGDVIASLAYVSNWYQIWVGQGYTASGDFAPLRHLWSLAVEEQFYLLWPLVMVLLLRLGRRRLPSLSWALLGVAVAIAALVAAVAPRGPIGTPEVTPDAYWNVAGRAISKLDFLYLSTPTRATGLLLGAAFAMVWRPAALLRGPMRRRAPLLDVVAVIGLVTLGALCWYLHIVTPEGVDAWLFRGGFLATGFAALCVIAAVTHQRSATGRLLGTSLLVWIGTRSYGLYLFHWPIYQGIRRVAGRPLTVVEFAVAMAASFVVAELSYRWIEMPVRRQELGRVWRRLQRTASTNGRRALAAFAALMITFVGVGVAGLATAQLRPNAIAEGQEQGAAAAGDPFATTTLAPRHRAVDVDLDDDDHHHDHRRPWRRRRPRPRARCRRLRRRPPRRRHRRPPRPPWPSRWRRRRPYRRRVTRAWPRRSRATRSATRSCWAPPGSWRGAGFCVDAVQSRAFVNGLDQVDPAARRGAPRPRRRRRPRHERPDRGRRPRAPDGRARGRAARRDRDDEGRPQLRARATTTACAPCRRATPTCASSTGRPSAADCPGDCFYDDGIHLKPDGRAFYAQQITAVTG